MTTSVAIGVDVGGTGTKGALVDDTGTVLLRLERPTDVHAGTKGVLGLVEDLLGRAAELDAHVVAAGVGAAGFVDAARGAVTFSANLVYDDPAIADALRARTGLPVAVDNDANAAAWGERVYGTARDSDHLALVMVGTGIGSGFVVGGRLVRGFTGAGAELGHTVVERDGRRCKCGMRGCLEEYASGRAIARMAREEARSERDTAILDFAGTVDAITAKHVAQAARQYDEVARRVMRRAGTALGIGLANVVNVFDPEVVVVGGGVARAGEPYLGPARDELAQRTNEQRRRPVRLDVTTLGSDGGIVGAAALAFDARSGSGP
ncbi:MAG TPA: ROK family protein [Actinomycetota bacterium]|nr:ROK family protein [Actinomycetota bacterium]